jgi:hypothetical protein
MRFYYLITLATVASLGVSCSRKAYYVSPVFGSNTPYHTVPLKNEKVASTLYGSASLQASSANDEATDVSSNLQLNAYRTHNLGFIQAYYGGGLTLGLYNVQEFDTSRVRNAYIDVKVINAHAGDLFYGTGNIHGGMHVAIPLSSSVNAPEWRLGSKIAIHKEFGKYLSFRKSLNPDSVTGVATSSTLGSISGYTEFMFPTSNGVIGMQLEVSIMQGKQYRDIYFGKGDMPGGRYMCINGTLNTTRKQTTLYMQGTLGTRMLGIHAGVNYLLTSRQKKPR